MKEFFKALRKQWKDSKPFRVWTIMAVIGLMINLALTVLWQMEVITIEGSPPVNVLKIYLEAGNRLMQREDLYIVPCIGSVIAHCRETRIYAMQRSHTPSW